LNLSRVTRIVVTISLAGASACFAVLGCGFLFWHFKIKAAIDTFRSVIKYPAHRGDPTQMDIFSEEANKTLLRSGIRSLPYLVSSLDPAEKTDYLAGASGLIISIIEGRIPPEGPKPNSWLRRTWIWEISSDESLESRSQKCRLIQDWWRNEGRAHYHWWKFWSPGLRCAEDD